MFRGRATATLAARKSIPHQFKRPWDQRFIGDSTNTMDAPDTSQFSLTAYLKRNRITRQPSSTWNNPNTPCHTQQQLSPKFPPLTRPRILPKHKNDRMFTTTTKADKQVGRRKRKKKPLLPSKFTTKDRLRLSSRPSSSAPNTRESNEINPMLLIKSPEELVDKMYSGLDVARTVVREGYASLRNTTADVAASSGVRGSERIQRKGLVMDANWWFWNLLLAASPAFVVALYCEFVVKPEMKIRYEERETNGSSEGEKITNASSGDEVGDDKSRGKNGNNMSPMRQRQEQQKRQPQEQQPDNPATTLNTSSNLVEILLSYTRPLLLWFSEQQLPPTPSSEHSRSPENSTKLNPDSDQEDEKEEGTRLKKQEQDLKELQSQIQMLKDKIDRQQEQLSDLNTGSGYQSDDVESKNSAKRESLWSVIGKAARSTMALGRRSLGFVRRSPDKSEDGNDGVSDSGDIPRNGVGVVHKNEK